MKRVVVIGSSCSGKTTLARRLSSLLGAPHVEIDALHWGPNWTERPIDDFRARVRDAVGCETWVVDGNYTKVRDLVWPRATDAVWLNYSFPLVFWRGLRRTLGRVVTGQELFDGCRESFRIAFFSRDSILWWIITSFKSRRREYEGVFAGNEFSYIRLTEFRRPDDAEAWVRSLSEDGGRSSDSPDRAIL